MTYSLKKGILKALGAVVTVAIAVVAVTQFADVELTVLIETHLFPLIAGLTVTGTLKWAHNFIKVKSGK
jgi:uncharacterized membrane protein YjjP (DUF1212 family)